MVRNKQCSSCSHYEDGRCTHNNGLLHSIPISESMADATHDCQSFDEARYKATPKGLLWVAIAEHIQIPLDTADKIWDSFEEKMVKSGYWKGE